MCEQINKTGIILHFNCSLSPEELTEKTLRTKAEKKERLQKLLDAAVDQEELEVWKKENTSENSKYIFFFSEVD